MNLKTKLFGLVVLTAAFVVLEQKVAHADPTCDTVYLANQNCIDKADAVYAQCMTGCADHNEPICLMCQNRHDNSLAICEEAYAEKCESTGCPC